MTQNRTWQRKIIETARERDELGTLYYFVQMDLPHAHRRPDARTQAANYPAGFVPVVPVSNEGADHWAHLLLELFKCANPGRVFQVALTSVDVLTETGIQWYAWGNEPPMVDAVCMVCGIVGPGRPGTQLGCSRGCLGVSA